MNIKNLLLGLNSCACGKSHTCPIDYVEIGDDAISKLPQICIQFKNILLVSDHNTYKAAGDTVFNLISNKITAKLILGFEGELLIPNEMALDTIRSSVDEKTDLIIGVGSGVINDLCKEVSFEKNLPYTLNITKQQVKLILYQILFSPATQKTLAEE